MKTQGVRGISFAVCACSLEFGGIALALRLARRVGRGRLASGEAFVWLAPLYCRMPGGSRSCQQLDEFSSPMAKKSTRRKKRSRPAKKE